MKYHKYSLIRFFFIFGLITLACGVSFDMGGSPTAAPSPMQMQQQPATPVNTVPPQPTAEIPPTPNPVQQPTVGPDQSSSLVPTDFQQVVERYYKKGYLSSTKGEYHHLDDFSKDWAQINFYDLTDTGFSPEYFLVKAHFDWQSAIRNPDPSGCGFAFHKQGNDTYLFFVDKDYVLLGSWNGTTNRFTRIGTTSGTGWVGLGNPGSADVALVVNQKKAYAFVNDQLLGSYTLDTDWLTGPGDLDYTILSGTNKDYGTRCNMTKVDLWIMDQ